jgi:hypothetical protein
MNVWEAHAASRLIDGPADPLPAPDRFEWTQRPGIGPGAEILGKDLNGRLIMELGCGAGHNTAHLTAPVRARSESTAPPARSCGLSGTTSTPARCSSTEAHSPT